MLNQKRRKAKVMRILDQLKQENCIVEEIKREEVYKWQCHICFKAKAGADEYDVNVIDFLDGSFMHVCNDCMEVCARATLTYDSMAPRAGVICSEEYARMVRLEHAN